MQLTYQLIHNLSMYLLASLLNGLYFFANRLQGKTSKATPSSSWFAFFTVHSLQWAGKGNLVIVRADGIQKQLSKQAWGGVRIYLQWILQTRDILRPAILSIIGRLSSLLRQKTQ